MNGRIWLLLPILWVQGFVVSPDLMKLPLLFAHYLEHQASDEELDLGTFIALHYSNDDHQSQDHSGHENLPFHHHHGAAVDHQLTKLLTSEPSRQVSFPVLAARTASPIANASDLLSGHNSELLRPPRTLA